MNALELRYALYVSLTGLLNDPKTGYVGAQLLGPEGDGTVRMKVFTATPTAEARTYTVTIKED